MAVRPGSQNARILLALLNGRWQTTQQIHRKAGTSRLNSRVSELRKHGYVIEHETVAGEVGARGHRYRLVAVPGDIQMHELSSALVQERDDLPDYEDFPRAPQHRFRIYRIADDDTREIVATTPTAEGVGVALCTLGKEGEFGRCSVGVFDCAGPNGDYAKGEWLINPYDARVTR